MNNLNFLSEGGWDIIGPPDGTDSERESIPSVQDPVQGAAMQCPFCGCRVSTLDEFCPVCSKSLHILPPKKKRGVDKGIIVLAAVLAAVICGGAACVYAAMRSHSEDYAYSSRPDLGQTSAAQQPAEQ